MGTVAAAEPCDESEYVAVPSQVRAGAKWQISQNRRSFAGTVVGATTAGVATTVTMLGAIGEA
jgi:hypothetical protein